ncbi:MAG TPA: PDGLE domain-containing protein, partial [Schlesneria sp.]
EALITGAVLSFVLARRGDLVPTPNASGSVGTIGRFAVTGLMTALAVAAIVAPFKSESPDGLDAAAQNLKFDKLEVERPALVLDDYAIPVAEPVWWPALPVSLAGIVGTLVVFIAAVVLAGITRRNVVPIRVADGSHGN